LLALSMKSACVQGSTSSNSARTASIPFKPICQTG
jgi:hypothetical protein